MNKFNNKKTLLFKLFCLITFSLLMLPLNAAEKKTKLTVTVVNIEKIEGFIRLVVNSSKEAFEAPADSIADSDFAVVMKVTDKEMTVSYEGLLPGEYAIKVFHDMDGNGKLNTNGLGIPKEPFGFSNNARGTFGPPDYEDCTFKLVAGKEKKISIKVK